MTLLDMARPLTVQFRLHVHLVTKTNDGLMLTTAHIEADPMERPCGVTVARGTCDAWSVSTLRKCPKKAAVMLPIKYEGELVSQPPHFVALCGGHLDVHRLDKPLPLAEGRERLLT